MRIAIMGAGLMGQRHISLIENHPRAELFGVIDPAPSAGAALARRGITHFSDLDALLAAGRPDGIIIATPNHLHVEHCTACIDARLPLLVEKPISDTLAGARTIEAAATAKDIPVLIGHHRRHNPIVAVAHQEITSGTLGNIIAVQASCWLYKPDDYYAETWRTRAGGGPIFINLIHDIDTLRHLCGDIASVQAVQSTATRGFEVEDTAAILLSFASGALGTITLSDTITAPWSWELTAGENPAYHQTSQSAYHIGGTHGALSLPDLTLWSQSATRSWWEPMQARNLAVSPGDPFVRQLDHFCEVIEGTATPLVTATEGGRTLAVIEAISRAATTGGRITVA